MEYKQIKVLHVDDDSTFLDISKQILELDGQIQVTSIASAKNALETHANHHFDIIISDYQMPEIDGLTFLAQLRDGDDSTPFILFTGKGREDVAIKALNLGADRYVNKIGAPETVYGELIHSIKQLTQKKHVEKLLYEHQERIKKIAAQTNGMLYQFKMRPDGSYCVPFCTDAIIDIFGCTPEEVKEDFSPIQNVFYKEDKNRVLKSIIISAKKLERWICEFRVKIPGKPIKWILGSSEPEKFSDGSIIWHGYILDITDRKKVIEKVNTQQKMLEAVTKNTRSGLSVISKDFEVLYANKVLTDLFGEVIGKKCYTVFGSRKTICPNCGVKEIFETDKESVKHNRTLIVENGNKIFLELIATAIRDENGKIISATEVAVDITDYAKNLINLKQEIQLQKIFLDNFPCAAMILQKDTREIIASNQRAKQMGAVPGKTCFETFAERDNSCPFCLAPKVWEKNTTQSLEVEYRNKWFKGIWVPFTDELYIHYIFDITKQKLLELKESEEKNALDMILNSSPIIIFYKDKDGKFIRVNDAFAKALNLRKEDFIGKTVFELYSDKIAQNMTKDDLEVLNSGKEKLDIIEKYESKDGIRWVKTDKIPVFGESDEVTGLVGFAQDITKQKKIQSDLHKSEKKYRNIVKAFPYGLVIADTNGIIKSVNKKVLKNTGYKRKDFVGKHFTELKMIKTKDKSKYSKGLDTISKGQLPKKFTITIVTPKKDERTVEVKLSFLKTDGEVSGVQAVINDITKEKEYEETLLMQSRMLDSVGEAIITTDRVGKIIYWNKAACDLYGWESKEVLGLNIAEVTVPEMSQAQAQEIMNNLSSGKDWKGKFTVQKKDGTTFPAIVTDSPVLNEDGNLIAIIGITRDITKEIQTELEKQQLIQDIKLTNKKLNLVGKSTRHDVRNKLSIIMNNCYLLKRKLPEKLDVKNYLNSIENVINQIYKIFEVSRVYEHINNNTLKEMSITKSFEKAQSLIDNSKKIVFENNCDSMVVKADSLLTTLVYNLVENSIKHGKNLTKVSLNCQSKKKHKFLIYEDDGGGIPLEEKEKIFQKAYGKGTGLGLYMIKIICSIYGWTIKENGKPNQGVRFVIKIPKMNELRYEEKKLQVVEEIN